MALTTNTCTKHGGYVEDQCPKCVEEAHALNVKMTEEFFRKHGKKRIELSQGRFVSIDDLFQYFRIRLLEEIKNEE